MSKQTILNMLPSCCDIGFLNITDCSLIEQKIIKEFFATTNTIIVLAHHVKATLEWAWYPHEAERNNNTCGADLHSKNVIERIEHCLKDEGYNSFIVPYPGKCGLRMKDLAHKTSLGHIGDSYLFLHKKWRPWVHLRLLFTDAYIESDTNCDINVCNHCGQCISACPAKAIDIQCFNGLACSEYQMAQEMDVRDNYYWKCEICARICPIGTPPLPLKIINDK